MFKREYPDTPDHVFVAPPTFFTHGLLRVDDQGVLILNYLLAQWIPGRRHRDGPFYIKIGMNDIFLPAHVNGNHWALIFIKDQWKTIYYYDSKWERNNGGRLLKATLHLLMEMVGQQWREDIDIAPWLLNFDLDEWNLVDLGTAVTQQPNGSDCGVYVCYYIFVLMFMNPRHYHVVDSGTNSMNGFRRKLGRMLFDRTLNMSEFGYREFLSL